MHMHVEYIPSHRSPGGEIGRRKGLKKLSTRLGNGRREWSQIRGNLSTQGGGNPELSPIKHYRVTSTDSSGIPRYSYLVTRNYLGKV
ncbi:hypothetical protein EDC23_1196 [Thiohalophilus thiocyanatoxydans]|uniref:Uncharacterized protein n=1 Tax=Thiohalophilus thiocyanatoxydans TaxID=381308 RepID=A0A4R8IPG0_9GAMM|nr:hypothetical protein EDC23_1196 [Thiohalophilus thiocyanatoxydans]